MMRFNPKLNPLSSWANNSMACNGICHRYKFVREHREESWYKRGAKRCTTCSIYIMWEGRWCPCCGYMLRSRPKGNQYKKNIKKPRIS